MEMTVRGWWIAPFKKCFSYLLILGYVAVPVPPEDKIEEMITNDLHIPSSCQYYIQVNQE